MSRILNTLKCQISERNRCRSQAWVKKNKPRIFTGRTDAEAEAPIFWPPDMKSQFIGKDPDARKG